MVFKERSNEGEAAREGALVARLRQFVEDSDLSFYKIASRVGTSGGILSMWLAGTARPRAEELAAIEKFLQDRGLPSPSILKRYQGAAKSQRYA
jgi:DNA transposition AAA+ family ATPase